MSEAGQDGGGGGATSLYLADDSNGDINGDDDNTMTGGSSLSLQGEEQHNSATAQLFSRRLYMSPGRHYHSDDSSVRRVLQAPSAPTPPRTRMIHSLSDYGLYPASYLSGLALSTMVPSEPGEDIQPLSPLPLPHPSLNLYVPCRH
ncbi:hypothetical protein Pmani_008877 [Petrolisthes manimaculis]|uniref:Uncharacterized protein n=1 Tax=Petrolisthes manimaculis TaxID=1843537 RepID=A0AAE1UDH8_9EUCA|nr:hypothetical protein Pmani_008877 [Petrolisthes manimaculis]